MPQIPPSLSLSLSLSHTHTNTHTHTHTHTQTDMSHVNSTPNYIFYDFLVFQVCYDCEGKREMPNGKGNDSSDLYS